MSDPLIELLESLPRRQVLPIDPDRENRVLFDFSKNSHRMRRVDTSDVEDFGRYIRDSLQKADSRIGLGGYGENRGIYRHSGLFAGAKARSLHLGLDLWVAAGTPVFAAFAGRVHSLKNNEGVGDYGPTVILEHRIAELRFYTLYGHLGLSCLESLAPGEAVGTGERIGEVGSSRVNGSWPPHLHFQVIRDLQGRTGDFPGVCAPEEAATYLYLCPDPNLILKLRVLDASYDTNEDWMK
ncbi:MAG TPA: peptidase M23 [Sediminispirochaeta sp.]|nr:peptidase M23 [Sediminispirochaeta sp.]